MIVCEKYETCPLCRGLQELGVPAPWILLYCKGGEFIQCARYTHRERTGKAAPVDLLPDGSRLQGDTAAKLAKWAQADSVA